MYTIGAKVNAKRANYYLPVQQDVETPICKKKRESVLVSQPHAAAAAAARILGRKYALTTTSYKYLEIGISVKPVTTVELIIGDNRGNQLILSIETWRMLIEKRVDIQQLLQADKPLPSPVWIQDLMIEFCRMSSSQIVKLTLSNNYLYLKPATMNNLFNFEYCIDHMYAWLCENIHLVSLKFQKFVNILQKRKIFEMCYAAKKIGESEMCYAAKSIRESEDFDGESLIDCELLACALRDIIYEAINK